MGQRASRPTSPGVPLPRTSRPRVSLTWALGGRSAKLRSETKENSNRSTDESARLLSQNDRLCSTLSARRAHSDRRVSVKHSSTGRSARSPEAVSYWQTRRTSTGENHVVDRSRSEPCLAPEDFTEQRKGTKYRRRREATKSSASRVGYEIQDLNDFLSNARLESPANIPVVLSTSTTLYRTRRGFQQELPLPLGTVLNAIFENCGWLYVQTAHAQEGYVSRKDCLPLGILPPEPRCSSSRPTPCWENSCDVFPRPCGNLTDSEKEQHLRGPCSESGVRTRTRQSRRDSHGAQSMCGERSVDRLYLRAASFSKIYQKTAGENEKQIAQEYEKLKSNKSQTNNCRQCTDAEKSSQRSRTQSRTGNSTNHSALDNERLKSRGRPSSRTSTTARQTLLAVTEKYVDARNSLTVQKGDVVVLVAQRDHRGEQWFHVKDRNNCEGLIPAAVAGHGFL